MVHAMLIRSIEFHDSVSVAPGGDPLMWYFSKKPDAKVSHVTVFGLSAALKVSDSLAVLAGFQTLPPK